jgi:hypothetical protein
LETFGERAFATVRDTPLSVRTLAVIVALLALTTGCSALQPAASPSAAAEPDPWAGFNNGYAKNEKPAEKPAETTEAKADPKADEKTSKTETTSAALTTDAKSDADEDDAKATKKKAAKKKPAKKKAGATVAAKKPRKRAKKS